jgi:hypothetical protein
MAAKSAVLREVRVLILIEKSIRPLDVLSAEIKFSF